MSTITLSAPVRRNSASVHARPSLARLVAVELRKMVNTRAGFWLQIATIAITMLVVAVRSALGDAADHTFASLLSVGLQPAAVLLPVVVILLVTSEWSQRTGMITFALVPVRSRILGAKLIASLALALAMLVACVAIVAAGVLVASPGIDDTWSHAATLIAQSAVFLTAGMRVGVAFGAPARPSARHRRALRTADHLDSGGLAVLPSPTRRRGWTPASPWPHCTTRS